MKNREYIFKLLYQAFIEIREEAYYIENTKIYRISDLLHNVPLIIEGRGFSEQDFERIVAELEKRAEANGMKSWLDNVKKQL